MFLGIGYLPRKTGPRLWRVFDAAEIREDMAHIAELGIQGLRIPLFWADFQPGVHRIAPKVFDRFGRFLQLAEDVGLKVVAGLWTGFWDGALWWPDWGVNPIPLPPHWPLLVQDNWLTWGRMRSPFVDERMLNAQKQLLHELVPFYANHPALLGWELLPGFGRLSASHPRDDVRRWLEDVMTRMNAVSSQKLAFFLIAFDAFENPNTIAPQDILQVGGLPGLSIATFASDRRHLPLSSRWIAFAMKLAMALSEQPLPLFLAGLPTVPPGQRSTARDGVYYANEEEAAEHLAEIIAMAQEASVPSLWFWRWADIPEDQWRFPPYNRPNWRRYTGLLRADGSEKKLVQALTAEIAPPHYPDIDVDLDAYHHDPYRYLNTLWKEFDHRSR